MKAVGNSITKVSLPVGQEANARKIKHVAGQGPIYVRTLQKINLPELQVVESFFFMEKGVFCVGQGINRWFRCDENVVLTLIVIFCVHNLDRVHFCC